MNATFKEALMNYQNGKDPEPAINREDWLNNALAVFAECLRNMGRKLPEEIRVSCGFPKGRAKAIGQCWDNTQSKDGHFEIFISPEIAEPCDALDVLLHEVGHVAAGLACGHKGAFKRFVNDAGLEGRATATTASPELLDALRMGVLPHLGKYPHAELRGENTGKKKQTTRMVKLTCPGCGMVIRTTQKWIEETGAPVCCSCQEQFQTDEGETGGSDDE